MPGDEQRCRPTAREFLSQTRCYARMSHVVPSALCPSGVQQSTRQGLRHVRTCGYVAIAFVVHVLGTGHAHHKGEGARLRGRSPTATPTGMPVGKPACHRRHRAC
eukprot:scaffold30105_cov247-Isochrysis_galbana.AAC.1